MYPNKTVPVIREATLYTPSSVASDGTALVSSITQYLSTLPTPVDVLEDLASTVSVTSSLLTSLELTIVQYRLPFTAYLPFIQPLCSDISAAFEELKVKFEEAREKGVFGLNERGLVRTPRFVWADVVGGTPGKAGVMRRRLCVEKYRVRVLIDAVRYKGLSDLKEK
jgi:hypothetical protein